MELLLCSGSALRLVATGAFGFPSGILFFTEVLAFHTETFGAGIREPAVPAVLPEHPRDVSGQPFVPPSQPLPLWGGSSQKYPNPGRKATPRCPQQVWGGQVFAHRSRNQSGRHQEATQHPCLPASVSPSAKLRHGQGSPERGGIVVLEISSGLPQKVSPQPRGDTGLGQGPWGGGRHAVTGNLLRAPKSADLIPPLPGSTCSGIRRAPAEPISTQFCCSFRSPSLPRIKLNLFY